MTKEELLSKGISEEVADEIIAAFDNKTDENSLHALKKALEPEENFNEKPLLKAKGGNEKVEKEPDKGDEEEDDEKMEKSYGNMKKAVEDIDQNNDGAIMEMTDLKPFTESLISLTEEMCKAITNLSSKVEKIEQKAEKNYSLMQKAAKVQVEQAENLDKFLSESPTFGPRGIVASEKMQKAISDKTEHNKQVYSALFKATSNGNKDAGIIISHFESVGKNYDKLSPKMQNFVNDLMKAEAN